MEDADRSGWDGEVQGLKRVIAVANIHVSYVPAPVPRTLLGNGGRGGKRSDLPRIIKLIGGRARILVQICLDAQGSVYKGHILGGLEG